MQNPLLTVTDLSIGLHTLNEEKSLVQDISFTIQPGETVALIGESGSGKTLTARAIMGIFTSSSLRIQKGSILFQGQELTKSSKETLRKLRQESIGYVGQNPLSSLNPSLSIGYQLTECLTAKENISKKNAEEKALHMLHLVKIHEPHLRLRQYPHELSGGMRQRVLIAMALINGPKLLIADEPTTALDVTVQASVLSLLQELKKELNMSLLLITHDFGIIAQVADTVHVMSCGHILESGSVDAIFYNPKQPYTQSLLAMTPKIGDRKKLDIPHKSINTNCTSNQGCPFLLNCPHAMHICAQKKPPSIEVEEGHNALCWNLIKEQQS